MSLKEVRNEIYLGVREELLGPGSEKNGIDIEEEVITDRPSQRYSTGILFTKPHLKTESNLEKINEEDEEDEEDENDEHHKRGEREKAAMFKEENNLNSFNKEGIEDNFYEEINNAHIVRKSSMGLTFFTNKNLGELELDIIAARYYPTKLKECMVFYNGDMLPLRDKSMSIYIYNDNNMLKLKNKISYENIKNWRQIGLFDNRPDLEDAIFRLLNQCKNSSYKRKKLNLKQVKLEFNKNDQAVYLNEKENLKVFSIKKKYDNYFSITVMLINQAEGKDETKYLFQPQLIINSEVNNFLFVESNNLRLDINPELDLLYRNKKVYGVGHGVSVDFSNINTETRTGKIKTEYMPIYEIPSTNFEVKAIEKFDILSMCNLSDLSDLTKDEIIVGLEEFITNYKQWIIQKDREKLKLKNNLQEQAKRNIDQCKIASERMSECIEFFKNDDNAFLAFQLANKAMLIQRVQGSKKEDRIDIDANRGFSEYKKFDKSKARWRGFQLAFLLMTAVSIGKKDSKFRDIVDLIWIPTGGGKTEAYLGVTAFTIFYRRLTRGEYGNGTTIIMRYTLRLLAAQQFERAAKLICACEYIRKEEEFFLGDEEISIGLWIGGEQTPNTIKSAKEAIENMEKNSYSENKFQVSRCPWCKEKLIVRGNRGRGRKNNIVFKCSNKECYFEEGLPIQVVDECLYLKPATLLFSTVDKFAMLPWKGEAVSFFGYGSKNDCPELIIQDELHLISGPLGTLVGQFETAIDYLCSMKGIKPKIISSTATICEASDQVYNLYSRNTMQFPPAGIEIEDSFFTKEESNSDKPGRLYVGVCGIGQTQVTTEIRLFASILQRTAYLNVEDSIKDRYWTLVSYFNSIRELGKAATLIYDDVKDYMIRIATRTGNFKDLRRIYSSRELTSRKTSLDIKKTLDDLEKEYPNEEVINVLLATNMISVGVDVARMNVMSVIGQPKLTSEYIQASSRVGRRDPGIVFTLYDGRKSRDESHYEIFQAYHQGFYKYVEPTSITPFSEPALERMLHSVFITMVRHSTELNSEDSAIYFDSDSKEILKIKNYILNRVQKNSLADRELIEQVLDRIIKYWESKKTIEDNKLTYTNGENPLISKFYETSKKNPGFDTMTSMRNVDGEIKIRVLGRSEDVNEK